MIQRIKEKQMSTKNSVSRKNSPSNMKAKGRVVFNFTVEKLDKHNSSQSRSTSSVIAHVSNMYP